MAVHDRMSVHCKRYPRLIGWIASTYLPLLIIGSQLVTAQEPTFKVDVQLVRLLATVKDTQNRVFGNLSKRGFYRLRQ